MLTRQSSLDCFTFAYKRCGNHSTHLDVYPPVTLEPQHDGISKLPAVVYFHGGSLTVGNRKSWFPSWLHQRVVKSGMVFISADYTLLTPATGHDIVRDIMDLFRFLDIGLNQEIRTMYENGSSPRDLRFEVDTTALAVAGSSAGGLCVYLAAMHAVPKPKAILSLYGMGGDMLTWMYLEPKFTPFLRGREILEPADFAEYLHPACRELPHVSDSHLAYHPPTHSIPNFPANPRMLTGRLYLQMGTYLDYYTGAHQPSLSNTLRNALSERGLQLTQDPHSSDGLKSELRHLIPKEHLPLFPQFADLSTFPPTLLVHGALDSAVWIRESQNMHTLLRHAGVHVEIVVVEGKEHSFDYDPAAEGEFGGPGGLYDEAMRFLGEHLTR